MDLWSEKTAILQSLNGVLEFSRFQLLTLILFRMIESLFGPWNDLIRLLNQTSFVMEFLNEQNNQSEIGRAHV